MREDVLESMMHEVFQHAQINNDQAQVFEQELKKRLSKKDNKLYKATLPRIEASIDRLTDALVNGTITDAVYTKKLEKLEIKRIEAKEKEKERANTGEQTRFVQRFLELAKSLTSTYEMANSQEKAQMVKNAFSNLLIKDKTLYFSSRKWLQIGCYTRGVLECAFILPSSHRFPKLTRMRGAPATPQVGHSVNCL